MIILFHLSSPTSLRLPVLLVVATFSLFRFLTLYFYFSYCPLTVHSVVFSPFLCLSPCLYLSLSCLSMLSLFHTLVSLHLLSVHPNPSNFLLTIFSISILLSVCPFLSMPLAISRSLRISLYFLSLSISFHHSFSCLTL